MSNPLHALILAAGHGTRLKPYTDMVPKPLVPVVDRSILEHQVRAIAQLRKTFKVKTVCCNAHHLADQVQEAAAQLGIDRVFVESPKILGTGGPLHRMVREGWKGEILVLNGDNYHNFDLVAFVRAARKSLASFALLCVDHPEVNTIEVDVHGRVSGVTGRYSVENAVRNLTFSGVSWYSPKALARMEASDFSIVDFWMREAESGILPLAYTAQSQATWIDMGTPLGLYRACQARLVELSVDRWVDPFLALQGVDVGPGAIVSAGSWIGTGSSLHNCIVLPNARIEENSRLENCIVGAGFRWDIGA